MASRNHVSSKPPAEAPNPRGVGAKLPATPPGEAVLAAAPPGPIPIPLGQDVLLTVTRFNATPVVSLDGAVVDPIDPNSSPLVFDLQPLVAGDHTLRWSITPFAAPWSYAVSIAFGGASQILDQGAGNTVSDPRTTERVFEVS